jgi:N-acetylglucosaminyldiphosphoundecaprenol N-acetyl-beta-D-mannosaminyltransferase
MRITEIAPEMAVKRLDILGCPIDSVSFEDTLNCIRKAILAKKCLHVITANTDFVVKARHDAGFTEELWNGDLVVPDGVPVLWAAAILGTPLRGRVNGTDLASVAADLSEELGCSVAMAGAEYDYTLRAAENMRKRCPKAQLFPIETPYPLTPEMNARLIDDIRNTGAKILLLALGTPKQERWLQKHLPETGALVGIGIGSAFDMISGAKPRAPKWMQQCGLEWFHRMLMEPRRLGKRYFLDFAFFGYLFKEVILRRFSARKDKTEL